MLEENRYVRIDIIPYGDKDTKETVKTKFREIILKDGGTFESDIDQLIESLYEGPQTELETRLAALKLRVRSISQGIEDLNLRDQRFATYLRALPKEVLDKIDIWFP